MQDESNQIPGEHDWRMERSLVLIVLDHPERCSRPELEAELHDVDPEVISNALRSLKANDVVRLKDERVSASRCVRRLDTLGLIAV